MLSVNSSAQTALAYPLPTPASRVAPLPRVGIVIVTYNSLTDVQRCLESLQQLSYPNFFVVIVDNNSPDGSGEEIALRLATNSVHVICNPENRGFAAGNNIGIRHAVAYGAKYCWLLNADTTVDSDALSALVSAAQQDPRRAAVGSKIFYGAQGRPTDKIWSAGGTIDAKSNTVSMRGSGDTDSDAFKIGEACDYVPGCSLLVHRSVIDTIGYLPEEYFMYFEETDWCLRMQRAGYYNWFEPKSLVFHHFTDEKMQTPFTVYYYNRNQRLFWSRRAAASRAQVYWRTLVGDLPRAFVALRGCKDTELRSVFRAHIWSCVDFVLGRHGKRR